MACEVLGWTEERWRMEYDETFGAGRSLWRRSESVEDQERLLPFYASDWYAASLTECFSDYARTYVKRFAEWWVAHRGEYGQGELLDLGAGIGASTRLLHELTGDPCIFHAYGPGSQLDIACRIIQGGVRLEVSTDSPALVRELNALGIIAFDVVEHVREVSELLDAITDSDARVFACANSFVEDFGHWKSYRVNGSEVARSAMPRTFGKEMRQRGWRQAKERWWNNRPQVWLRG